MRCLAAAADLVKGQLLPLLPKWQLHCNLQCSIAVFWYCDVAEHQDLPLTYTGSSRPGVLVSRVLMQVYMAASHTLTVPSKEQVASMSALEPGGAKQQSKMVSVWPGCVHHSRSWVATSYTSTCNKDSKAQIIMVPFRAHDRVYDSDLVLLLSHFYSIPAAHSTAACDYGWIALQPFGIPVRRTPSPATVRHPATHILHLAHGACHALYCTNTI
jgi:hypothetical protein